MSDKKVKKDGLISLKDIEGSSTNPFMVELKGKMYLQPRANTIIAKGQSIVDTKTGEIIEESVLIGKRKIVDKSQFAKLYASEIGILYELTKPAQNVFLYLTKVMDYDNKAIFDYKKEFKNLGYTSEMQPLKGLRELITKNIIAPHTVSNIYWLNPTIVCKGERFAKYVEYVVGTDEEIISQENLLKKQNTNKIQQLPEQITNKINRANTSKEYTLFDQLDENPYK